LNINRDKFQDPGTKEISNTKKIKHFLAGHINAFEKNELFFLFVLLFLIGS
jgi:hypothetical protein